MSTDGEPPFPRRTGKSEAAFRTISEVADELDVPQHVLRFWESKFPQVRPLKRGGGRRYYRPEDVALLRNIRDKLYSEGYTIKGVQKLLREGAAGRETPASRQNDLDLPLPMVDPEDDVRFDDGETGEGEGGDEDAPPEPDLPRVAAPPAVPAPVLAPEVRRELEDLLDELEQLRRLLQPHS
jgi:DNA-binding transcriptional MerR regulator